MNYFLQVVVDGDDFQTFMMVEFRRIKCRLTEFGTLSYTHTHTNKYTRNI